MARNNLLKSGMHILEEIEKKSQKDKSNEAQGANNKQVKLWNQNARKGKRKIDLEIDFPVKVNEDPWMFIKDFQWKSKGIFREVFLWQFREVRNVFSMKFQIPIFC